MVDLAKAIPPKLYKYVPADAAKSILRSGALRFSSPILFNDPFDAQIEASFPFTDDNLEEYLGRRVLGLLDKNSTPPAKLNPPFVELFELFKSERAQEKTNNQILESYIASARLARSLSSSGTPQKEPLAWKSRLREFRVSAFSDRNESISMWSHYADHHRGVCIEFVTSESNIVGQAKQVLYEDDLPKFLPVDQWGDFLLGLGEPDFMGLLRQYLLRKSVEWKYEREWRVFFPNPGPDELFIDVKFRPEDLTGIFLGVRISELDRLAIESLCRGRFNSAKIFLAKRNPDFFRIDFAPL